MKAAVMTWHTYNNYGSLLQAYALQEAFSKGGVTSYLVDYDPECSRGNEFQSKADYLRHHAKRVLKHCCRDSEGPLSRRVFPQYKDERRDSAYQMFRSKYLRFTEKCEYASDFFKLNEEYEILACGSDQIWAPIRFNPRYFLDFAKDSARCLAYAPSIGLPEIEDEAIRRQVAFLAGRIEHLSVREKRGAEILESLLGSMPEVVLDPTALLTGVEWRSRFSIDEATCATDPYAICYFLSNDKQKWSSAKKIAEANGLKLLGIPVFKDDSKRGVELCKGVGPGEFLSLVANASMIFTDSFHGTMFSLLFHVEPFVYRRFSDKSKTNQNSRIDNILELVGLNDVVFQDATSSDSRAPGEIDWIRVDERMNVARQSSESFLFESIDGIKKHLEEAPLPIFPPTMTCCGCGACVAECPKGALSLSENPEGFIEASIRRELCVECGLCAKMCPFSSQASAMPIGDAKLYSYASADSNARRKSSSGGISNDIAEEAIERGCEVTGCSLDDGCMTASHRTVSKSDGDVAAFQGSKYIQSDFREAFKTIDHDSRQVVFGTPCQIAALRNVIKHHGLEDRFLLVDLICHGVPTRYLYSKRINEFLSGNESVGELISVLFRDKEAGSWQDMCLSVAGTRAGRSSCSSDEPFYSFFNQGSCYMESCYECLWRKNSSADLRIGDYWGSRFSHDKEGVSMVAVFTPRGEEVISALSEARALFCNRESIADYISVQQMDNYSRPIHRAALIEQLKNSSMALKDMEKCWCPELRIQGAIRKVRACVSRVSHG